MKKNLIVAIIVAIIAFFAGSSYKQTKVYECEYSNTLISKNWLDLKVELMNLENELEQSKKTNDSLVTKLQKRKALEYGIDIGGESHYNDEGDKYKF